MLQILTSELNCYHWCFLFAAFSYRLDDFLQVKHTVFIDLLISDKSQFWFIFFYLRLESLIVFIDWNVGWIGDDQIELLKVCFSFILHQFYHISVLDGDVLIF